MTVLFDTKKKRSALIPSEYCGTVGYKQGYRLQLATHDKVSRGENLGKIILLQHADVLTLGKNATVKHIRLSQQELERKKIPIYRVERGGNVTAHMPGQLVVYPILHLSRLGFGIRQYIEILESAVLEFLGEFGLRGASNQFGPGVWCQGQKIASIGVRVKKRTTFHGLAINLTNSLELFGGIHPCGDSEVLVGRVSDFCSVALDMIELARKFSSILTHLLGFAGADFSSVSTSQEPCAVDKDEFDFGKIQTLGEID